MNTGKGMKLLKSEIARFVLVGILATGMHYGLYLLLSTWINPNASYTIGYLLSFIMNYYLSNYFTFKTKPNVKRGAGFIASHLANYILHMALLNLFLWLGFSLGAAPLFVYAIAIPVNFILVRLALKGRKTKSSSQP